MLVLGFGNIGLGVAPHGSHLIGRCADMRERRDPAGPLNDVITPPLVIAENLAAPWTVDWRQVLSVDMLCHVAGPPKPVLLAIPVFLRMPLQERASPRILAKFLSTCVVLLLSFPFLGTRFISGFGVGDRTLLSFLHHLDTIGVNAGFGKEGSDRGARGLIGVGAV